MVNAALVAGAVLALLLNPLIGGGVIGLLTGAAGASRVAQRFFEAGVALLWPIPRARSSMWAAVAALVAGLVVGSASPSAIDAVSSVASSAPEVAPTLCASLVVGSSRPSSPRCSTWRASGSRDRTRVTSLVACARRAAPGAPAPRRARCASAPSSSAAAGGRRGRRRACARPCRAAAGAGWSSRSRCSRRSPTRGCASAWRRWRLSSSHAPAARPPGVEAPSPSVEAPRSPHRQGPGLAGPLSARLANPGMGDDPPKPDVGVRGGDAVVLACRAK